MPRRLIGRNPRRVLAALIVLASFPLVQPAATAHTPSSYWIDHRWEAPYPVRWQFTAGFPGGSYRSRVIDAHTAWNNLGQPMQWQLHGDYSNYNPFGCPQPERANSIHWINIGFDAVTLNCDTPIASGGRRLQSANIVLDSAGPTWWTSTGSVPPGYYDLWSFATHEIGHANGQDDGDDDTGHWRESHPDLCPEPDDAGWLDRESLCPLIYLGSRVQRLPSIHDSHTFQARY